MTRTISKPSLFLSIIHDVSRVTANSTVAVGADDVSMSPVTTEVTSDREAKTSGVARCGCATMRTGVVWTIFAIVTIVMTVETDGIWGSEGNAKVVWAREKKENFVLQWRRSVDD